MNTREILRALQSGTIGVDEAKRQLAFTDASAAYPGARARGVVVSTLQSPAEATLSDWSVGPPSAGEITVQVRASAINFPDVLCIRGLYPTMPPYPFVPGFEVAGVVTALGVEVSGLAIGDAVIALTGQHLGGHASFVNLPASNAIRKPDGLSFEDACSLPVVFSTVYYAFELARLAAQEHVLIQSAAGGCGLMALQLAHQRQCVVYATSSRSAKLDLLRAVGAPHLINYRTSDVDREIRRLTSNRGVDVVLNTLAGSAIQQGLNSLAPYGRYLELAVHALKTSPKLDLSRLVQNQTFHSIDLRRAGLDRRFGERALLEAMVAMIRSGQIVPIVSRVYPLHQIAEAFQHVSDGHHVGKVVVSHTAEAAIDRTADCVAALVQQKARCDETSARLAPLVSVRVDARHDSVRDEGIAIVGMAGRFPGAKSVEALWKSIASGQNCITEVPAERWPTAQFYDANRQTAGKSYSKWMGVVDDAEEFDPLFFNISPAEAEWMDPQQRLFLEECWHCLEDAGIAPSALSGTRCGVFVGCGASDYGRDLRRHGLHMQGLTGGASSILAARIAYFLNLTGPCLAIETACSSSLVAIAQACDGLMAGNCDLALAGGVHLMFGPALHIMTSDAGMLSKDGRCFTFDARANGFVPGEGVGVIVLKRVADAKLAGDRIAGVIRGWGVNQDGRTNGITAPSVKSQAALEKEVYRRFAIDPATITLIEAHGTGTALGDPIELEALTDAFRGFTDRTQYCAVGSIKSNIGHLMTAAGVAGVIKVLLALRHRLLPPTINFESPNPHLSLDGSPFYVNTRLQPWTVDHDARRRAAVSSFGFSGTNAHLVIEERPDSGAHGVDGQRPRGGSEPVLFTLSAKSKSQLKGYASDLREALAVSASAADLRDAAYTLQVGREPMEYRLAILAESHASIAHLLDAYANDEPSAAILTGYVKDPRGSQSREADHLNGPIPRTSSAAVQELRGIAEAWVEGATIDWDRLYPNGRPGRVSLPRYPFAHKRYTPPVSIDGPGPEVSSQNRVAVLHPLVHRNTSDFTEQRYTSTYTGGEVFLDEHRIEGQRVMPGVALLELARFAAEQALGGRLQGRSVTLSAVSWPRPLIVSTPVTVHVRVRPVREHSMSFQVYTDSEGELSEPLVYCEGVVELRSVEPVVLDPRARQEESTAGCLTGAECDEAFQKIDFRYGPAFQAIEKIWIGADVALAQLKLRTPMSGDGAEWVLQPGLLDSALRSSIALSGGAVSPRPALPVWLQELTILAACPADAWAVLRRNSGSGHVRHTDAIDIDICDSSGAVCLAIRGFAMVARDAVPRRAARVASDDISVFTPDWVPADIPDVVAKDAASLAPVQRHVILCDENEIDRTALDDRLGAVECTILRSSTSELPQTYARYCCLVLEVLQRIQRSRPDGPVLVQLAGYGRTSLALHGLGALLRTAQLETRTIRGQIILVDEPRSTAELVSILNAEAREPQLRELRDVRYRDGKRWIAAWRPLGSMTASSVPWRPDGVYVISGGAGQIGLLTAEEIARKAPGARCILLGRRECLPAWSERFDRIESLGAHVTYRQADVADAAVVARVIDESLADFGSIHGVVHAAGILRDGYLYNKRPEDLRAVLAPKVAGIVSLDLATRRLPLDVFIAFSSFAGAMGNVAQADYAAANAFVDAYARHRASLVDAKERHGRTLSIDWPLWRDGGMRVDAMTEQRIAKETGLVPLESEAAFEVMYKCLAGSDSQVMVLPGDAETIRHRVLGQQPEPDRQRLAAVREADEPTMDTMRTKVERVLVRMVSSLLRIDPHDIDRETELGELGFDSISFAKLGGHLADHYGIALAPTVFFEHRTVDALATYVLDEHRAMLTAHYGRSDAEAIRRPEAGQSDTEPAVAQPTFKSRLAASRYVTEHRHSGATPEPVAVIGMSGCFPKAPDLHAFWDNLVAGRDCIDEIPPDRWDWRQHHGDPGEDGNVTSAKHGGFIDGVREFDPLFFGISPAEAELMDPQQRLLMMYVWRAIEDAGYAPHSLAGGDTAIFVGTGNTGYSSLLDRANVTIRGYTSTGSVPSVGPNRMSFLLDWHGPSEPVETACSSSLVAVHRALEAIEHGRCDAAIVGGVNTIVTPDAHIGFAKAGMLSRAGRCKAFSDQADGYVRGEGVAMLFLKRLSLAERDGDHIYAVLLGSAENHGGRASSLTAPNPKAQTALLESAYVKAGIDPGTVGYVEAHGTGTPLGDPIEINALKSAFGALRAESDAGFAGAQCGIGSVKTNIGHLELAAGIAGLVKVVLQLAHRTLVKSLHAERLNPHIELDDSPFYIVRATTPWRAINGRNGAPLPRRAGVSSFGFGGVNAHVVVQEYVDTRAADASSQGQPAVVVLSAKTQRQLQQQAQQLLEALGRDTYSASDLSDIAFTLQVGRDAMEERLGLIVHSLEALKLKLTAWLDGDDRVEDLFRGRVQRGKDALSVFAVDDDLKEAIDTWFRKRKYEALLDLWAKGMDVDWWRLHPDGPRRRLSLPTYPFARDRYWVPEGQGTRASSGAPVANANEAGRLHPLVHQNTSTLSCQEYTTIFTGDEPFLTDHVVRGHKVLPGVAHLEMVRAALQLAAGPEQRSPVGIQLTDVIWRRPLVVGSRGLHVHLSLEAEAGGAASFEVYSRAEGSNSVEHLYSQGHATWFTGSDETIDLATVREHCRQGELTREQCYAAFEKVGLVYGPAHRALERVFCGAGQALAEIVLPESLASSTGLFVLDPSLMDAALQAIIGLRAGSGDGALLIPSRLKRLDVLAACPTRLWSWVRYTSDTTSDDDSQQCNLDLFGDDGRVCVRVRGLMLRKIGAGVPSPVPARGATAVATPSSVHIAASGMDGLASSVARMLRQEISRTLKVKEDDIDDDTELDEYGFDSIMLTELAHHLNRTYDLQITPTLFFDRPTIAALAPYLATEYEPAFVGNIGRDRDVPRPPAVEADGPETALETRGADRQRPSHTRRRPQAHTFERGDRHAVGVEPLAVIGMSGRFPMAADLDAYWKNLVEGKDCIQEIPPSRWDWRAYYGDPKHAANRTNVKWGGFIDGVAEFDPLFFGIPPAEAEVMDPQQRLLMTYVWLALEDAGYAPSELTGKTGLFVGTGHTGYGTLIDRADVEIRGYSSTGSVPSVGPNRMSYFLNLRGPSEPIETACSSSLVALHRAMVAIRTGECDTAIAGGVNTIVTPDSHIAFSKAGMLSTTGQCRAFSDRADGYVRGEGVGMLVLKRLARAEEDGDHIYGVLRGSAVGHSGRTSSLTAPSARAQAELLESAYLQAGIDAHTITYIEAHGTGTPLGDPIEVDGLKAAFSALYARAGNSDISSPRCGLGSVKTNIGHLELAAGVAGVIKVLLQMKHQTLVKSRHSERVNPYIDLGGTPFYLVRETQPWSVATDARGNAVPRRAGVSSFGFGGVNAHIVIEEYVTQSSSGVGAPPSEVETGGDPHVIVLSARNEARLRERARQLLQVLDRGDLQAPALASIAYTLQIGRDAMEERLGFVARTFDELRTVLRAYTEGHETAADLHRGHVKRHKDMIAVVTADDTFQATMRTWIDQRKFATLLALWSKGLNVPWRALYGGATPPRISLPGYPFARETYWVPASRRTGSHVDRLPSRQLALHPLLHQNCSTLDQQRYISVFSGDEFFFADHVVAQQRVLPGAAYLEMAIQAVRQATGGPSPRRIVLRNVVWSSPAVATGDPVRLHVDVSVQDRDDGMRVEIYEVGSEGGRVVHAQANAHLIAEADLADGPALNLPALTAACAERNISSEECYGALTAAGLHYGPAFRCIEELRTGVGQVLATISIPEAMAGSLSDYVLHPSIVDAAFQSAIGLTRGDAVPSVPFALGELTIHGQCPAQAVVSIRVTQNAPGDRRSNSLDLTVSDRAGKVYVQLQGLSTRAISSPHSSDEAVLMYRPVLREREMAVVDRAIEYHDHLVLFCGVSGASEALAESDMPGARCRLVPIPDGDAARIFLDVSTRVMEEVRAVVNPDPQRRTLVQVVTSADLAHGCLRGLSALAKSARLDYPNLFVQSIEIAGAPGRRDVLARLREAREVSPVLPHVACDGSRLLQVDWEEITVARPTTSPWRNGGVYLITGGAGRLGRCVAKDIAAAGGGARIILAGRSTLHEREDWRRVLSVSGESDVHIEYRTLDVARADDCVTVIESIVETFGGLHGIIHAAGIVRDNLLANKSATEWSDVLAPKVAGVVNLDEASRDVRLDFFVAFSSLAGAIGNRGQSDYAAANGFMDAYLAHRCALVASGARHGKSVTINWPLWRDGGMRVDAETERLMRSTASLVPLETSAGLEALYQGLAGDASHLLVASGQRGRIGTLLSGSRWAQRKSATHHDPVATKPDGSGEGLAARLRQALAAAISSLLKVDAGAIDADGEWTEYGFDSITLTELTNHLNRAYGLDLVPVVLFEHPTLDALSQHLIASYKDHIVERLDPAPAGSAARAGGNVATPSEGSAPKAATEDNTRRVPTPVAVIGISGCFPKAPDLDAFWDNLVNGADCISEVPPSRWDWREWYGDPNREPNKTRIKWGGFIDGIDEFDPLFFGVSPAEAALMDPQQRLLMTHAWQAIEDAGYAPHSLSGTRTAIFVGTGNTGYGSLVDRAGVAIQGYSSTSAVPSIGPNRVSHLLNLRGPSEPIETACSSSLVALHHAMRALDDGSCDAAIVGGVNTIPVPGGHIGFEKAGMLSEDGRCRTFSDRANGYVRGEGVGMLFVKRLADAEEARDHIYGVVRSSAENHGGRASSLTAPNPAAQADLIATAYAQADIDPRTVGYIEAHGTGTRLGDPVEVSGLARAFATLIGAAGNDTVPEKYCGLGSVKSNVGHLELAAGVAGVLKVLLQLKHGTLVKTLHCETLNPYLQLDDNPFFVVRERQAWVPMKNADGRPLPRRAGVSSFGFGGVNAHVVIEEYIPPAEPPTNDRSTRPFPPVAVVLSARTFERLREQTTQLLTAIRTGRVRQDELADVAYTLQVGRDAMDERLALVVDSIDVLESKLLAFLDRQPDIADLFHGQIGRAPDGARQHTAGSELQTAAAAWRAGDLRPILLLWMAGATVDWNGLYTGERRRRRSLPTYPFARDRYWIAPRSNPSQPGASALSDNRSVAEQSPVSRATIESPGSDRQTAVAVERFEVSGHARQTAQDQIKDIVRESVAAALSIEERDIQDDRSFAEYGVDSIVAVNVVNELNERCATALNTIVLFDYNTVSALSNHIGESHPEVVARFLEQDRLDLEGDATARSNTVPALHRLEPLADDGAQGAVALRPARRRAPVDSPEEPIAVVGLSARFAGSPSVDELWHHLAEGHDLVGPVTRWDLPHHYAQALGGATAGCTQGSLIDGIDLFDAGFFRISALEARHMDPQQRLFLEEAWKALEHAGYAGDTPYHDRCGVYVGCATGDYEQLFVERPPAQAFWGNAVSVIPARIAYFLNLRGPAVAVDTACSSSLVAMHLACQSLWRQETDMALVGGVHIQSTPRFYVLSSRGGMLSPTGRCHTFGERADGFVPGEGVGVVVLKRLADALADGDHVNGVIRATGINQDGATNGITAPSSVSQESLLCTVYERYGIDPDAIQMVEAHGTGTNLGDPIEFEALTRAFRRFTSRRGYCALGSIKTNLGHTATAAGVAGVIKALLSLQHRTIPASLHCETPNPRFDVDDSPFFVNTRTRAWEVAPGHARRAAVSAFGFSGTNAHVVIEEPPPAVDRLGRRTPAYLIVLSARTADQLRQQAEQLRDWLVRAAKAERSLDCGDISYTLLLGRTHFAHRLACLVRDERELSTVLAKWLVKGTVSQVYVSEIGEQKRREQPALIRFGNLCLRQCAEGAEDAQYRDALAAVAELYVQGYALEFPALFADGTYRRVALPTYPFSRDSHWVQPSPPASRASSHATDPTRDDDRAGRSDPLPSRPVVHPFLDRLDSSYGATLTGDEPFLRDHVVNGHRVLPGAVYLEMARAAVVDACSGSQPSRIVLQNIVWSRPLAIDRDTKRAHVRVRRSGREEHERVSYDVFTRAGGAEAHEIVHCQGIATVLPMPVGNRMEGHEPRPAEADLAAVREACSGEIVEKEALYARYRELGIQYGPAHRAVERVYVGDTQALAEIALPAEALASNAECWLHPSLVDGALQATLCLMMKSGEVAPALPFALQELELLAPCPSRVWAWVRRQIDPSTPAVGRDGAVQRFDLDLCDEAGVVAAAFRGFSTRRVPGGAPGASIERTAGGAEVLDTTATAQPLALLPIWDAVACERVTPCPRSDDRVVLIGAGERLVSHLASRFRKLTPLAFNDGTTIDDIAQALREVGPLDHIVWIAPEAGARMLTGTEIVAAQQSGVLQLFRLAKALIRLRFDRMPLGLSVITYRSQAIHAHDPIDPTHASVHGLVGSMAKEYENWKVRLLDLPASDAWYDEDIATLPFDAKGNALVCREHQWYRQRLIPVDATSMLDESASAYRRRGTYVVIGGAGGIGEVWSEYVVRRYQAQVVWIGRRPSNARIEAKIAALGAIGPAPIYISADATQPSALQRAYDEIKRRTGAIHGVVHSAIVLLDQGLANLTEAHFVASLAAKLDTCVHSAETFQSEPLDFFLYFSSLNSFSKGPGQSSYAAACLFKDAYARYLSQTRNVAVRVMNWGYWGSVGIVAAEEYRQRMARHGIGSIEAADAMGPLEKLLAGPIHQLGLMKASRMLPGIEYSERATIHPAPTISLSTESLVARVAKGAGDRAQAARAIAAATGALPVLDAMLVDLLFAQLRRMGLDDDELSLAEIQRRCGIAARYRSWLRESLAILVRQQYLAMRDDRYVVIKHEVPAFEVLREQWARQKETWTSAPLPKAMVLLAEPALEALPDVLRGARPATEVLFPHSSMELVERVYKHNPIADFFNQVLADCVVAFLLARQEQAPRSKLRILEIGAGTGAASAAVFDKLRPHQDSIAEYCYTDLSPAFLTHARHTFGSRNPFLRYAIVNVERPLVAQHVELGSYDVVLASNVIHASPHVRQALRHMKGALVGGGALILNELSSVTLFAHLTFGLLDGWWRYQDGAVRVPGGPVVAPESWKRILESEGFGAVSFPAQAAHDLGQQIVLAESDGISRQPSRDRAGARRHDARQTPQASTSAAGPRPEPATPAPAHATAVDATVLRERVRSVISACLAESVQMDVADVRHERFADYGIDSIIAVKLMTSISQHLGVILETTLLFDHETIQTLTDHVIETYFSELSSGPDSAAVPAVSRGSSSRTESAAASIAPAPASTAHAPAPVRLGSSHASTEAPGAYYRVVLERPGKVDDIRVVRWESPPLKPHELRVAIKAFSLNFGDLLCIKGLYPTMPRYPFTPGFEASGVVAEVGSSVTSVKLGEPVIVGTGDSLGGQASMIICSEDQVFPKPVNLSFEEAATMPAVSITMIDAFRRAQPRRGERILIQTATGGTGLVAVQLAKHHGLEIFATAGSQQKLDYLAELGVPHRINYLTSDFEAEVKKLTRGEGVDVVLNTLPGDAIQKGLRCLRSGGRYVEIAMTALKAARTIDLSALNDNQTFHSIDLRKLARANPGLMKAHRDEFVRLVESGHLRPTVYRSFSLDDIRDAYACLEQRHHIGKIAVAIPDAYAYVHGGTPVAGAGPISVPRLAAAGTPGRSKSPELVRLNGSREGRPVFWCHGALGGVEIYQPLAQQIRRPFFGIQARGWRSDRSPLVGLPAMAEHYADVVRSVQGDGPYDLGGYSLGGVLAYEIARRLQASGQPVASIVMLDSPDSTHLDMFKFSPRTAMLQAVNTALFSTIVNQPDRLTEVLIHRDETDTSRGDDAFFQHLVSVAQRRGVFKHDDQLRVFVQQAVKLHAAYEVEKFRVEALARPEEVAAYYFRNRSRRFWGTLEPYLTMTADEVSFDTANYWAEWERHLPRLRILDVESSSHLTLLLERAAFATISRGCADLYAREEVGRQGIGL